MADPRDLRQPPDAHEQRRPPEARELREQVLAAARGPRTAGHGEAYDALLSAILDGSELHYGASGDPDDALLLGDQRYAEGLLRLAELGDLHAVRELAGVISSVARAAAAGDAELGRRAWLAGAASIGGAEDAAS